MNSHMHHTLLALLLFVSYPPAFAQGLAGAYAHVRDSDGTTPKPHASVILTFKGGASGSVDLAAIQPGQEVTDSGKYAIRGQAITITFNEMEWEAKNQPFQFDGCTLVLPFKALSGKPGPGTSTWARRDPNCNQPKTVAAPARNAVPAGPFSPFSADEIITEKGQRRNARIFVSEKAVRSEGEENGRQYIAILRMDRGLLWTMSVSDRTYTELPFGAAKGGFPIPGNEPLERGCRIVGEEKVAGYTCAKQECRFSAAGNAPSETRWTAAALGGVIVKYVSGAQILELQNVRREALNPALFEVPAGYRKISR